MRSEKRNFGVLEGKPIYQFILEKVARFSHPGSGRWLEVRTTEPGMLFYSGFYTSDKLKRENGDSYGQFRAFCCEASRYPNGPNIAGSPGSITSPGKNYNAKTVFRLNW